MTSGVQLSGFDELSRRLNPQRLMDQIEKATEESLAEGKSDMRHSIETRGTGKTWQRAWNGRTGSYPGRVASGDMLNAVEGKITARRPEMIEGILGWADGSPDYFRYQNIGFRHVMAQTDVAGMRALRDASDLLRADLIERLGRIEL